MIDFLYGIIAAGCTIAATLALKRYGSGGGRCGKGAADSALREMYGQYGAEVRALAQRRMLNAPPDEDWLAEIRARASMSSLLALRRPLAADTARSVNSLDVIFEDAIRLLSFMEATHALRIEDSEAAAQMTRMSPEAGLRAQIEAEVRRGSRKHHRLPRWMRWIPKLVAGLDFCLFLYFFTGITGAHWADPLSPRPAFAVGLAVMVTALSYGCSSTAGRRMRAYKNHDGAVSLRELGTSTKAATGIAAAAIVAISALTFIQIHAGILYALGPGGAALALLSSLVTAMLAALSNFLAITVRALDGSDETALLASLSAIHRYVLRSERHARLREPLFRWASWLTGAIAVLAASAAAFYFIHPSWVAIYVIAIGVPSLLWPATAVYRLISARHEDQLSLEEWLARYGSPAYRLKGWTARDALFRSARRLVGFMPNRSSSLRTDDADRA